MKKKISKFIMLFFVIFFMQTPVQAEEIAWNLNTIEVSGQSDYQIGTEICVSPVVEGDVSGVTYKYVWMKNNWSKWGIISDFTEADSVKWEPESSGRYYLYVDAKDANGNIVSKNVSVDVQPTQYSFEGIALQLESVQKMNTELNLEVTVSGNVNSLEYKYVWMKDDWKEWGVLKAFGPERTVIWRPDTAGVYTIYVDIKDVEGNQKTYTRDFEISDLQWTFQSVSTDKPSPQEQANAPITICANTIDGENLQYKYVWMKDNWAQWGVISNYSEHCTCQWEPESTGEYTIYVDVMDANGRVVTKTISYTIAKNNWKYENIEFSPEEGYQPGDAIEIQAVTSGNTGGLTYKFVWAKEDWTQWGVIQNFSENSVCKWTVPSRTGHYMIYVDVKDESSEVRTQVKDIIVSEDSWEIAHIDFGSNSCIPIGEEISIQTILSGKTDGLKFKYVWMKDDWAKWGVLREFGENEKVLWEPVEAGNYSLYIDVLDQSGVTYGPYTATFSAYEFEGVRFSENLLGLGEEVEIYPSIVGAYTGAEFKFVWAKNSWESWGVIREFSSEDHVVWTPEEEGTYDIYVDMKMGDREVITRVGKLTVGNVYLAKIKEIQEQYLGVPYKWGGSNPSTGWDCSGFTQWALSYLGVAIPRSAASQAQGGLAINALDMSQWQPGDVICYYNTTSGKIGHAALYIGDGKLMHALNNRTGTIIHDVDYYERIDKETYRVAVRRYL